MRLKLYRAASVAEAMSLVRAELGPEALILSTRRLADGVELTAALEHEDLPSALPQPAIDLSFHSLPERVSAALSGQQSPDGIARALQRALRFAALPIGCPDDGFAGRPMLLDSAGINPFSIEDVAATSELIAAAQAVPVLVMQAGLHPDDAAEQANAFTPLGVRHLLPTRLDLSRRLGSIFAAALSADLALTEASAGPGAADPLLPVTPGFLADRLLGAAPPPPPVLQRPVFPTARAQAARAWSNEVYG